MSRIGKLPIQLPAGVTARVDGGVVEVRGPKGVLSHALRPEVSVEVEAAVLRVQRSDDSAAARAMHGLTRKLLANMVHGVGQGFTKTLEITGVGYRAEARGNQLYLTLGYSHPILYQLPEGVEAKVDRQVVVTLESRDRQLLGRTAAELRSLRPPEPYKGKGIKYSDEVVRRKAGKAAGAAGS